MLYLHLFTWKSCVGSMKIMIRVTVEFVIEKKNVSKLFFPLQKHIMLLLLQLSEKNNYDKNRVFYSFQLCYYLTFISPANISYLSITKQSFHKGNIKLLMIQLLHII